MMAVMMMMMIMMMGKLVSLHGSFLSPNAGLLDWPGAVAAVCSSYSSNCQWSMVNGQWSMGQWSMGQSFLPSFFIIILILSFESLPVVLVPCPELSRTLTQVSTRCGEW